MSDRSLIFTGWKAAYVAALPAGAIFQTRRIVKPQPRVSATGCPSWGEPGGPRIRMGPRSASGGSDVSMTDLIARYCPYGQPGEDRLWFREAWILVGESGEVLEGQADLLRRDAVPMRIIYRADGEVIMTDRFGWRAPIHMPRWSSRGAGELLEVRVELASDISEADALAEGCGSGEAFQDSQGFDRVRDRFRWGWTAMHGADAWDAWCWALMVRKGGAA